MKSIHILYNKAVSLHKKEDSGASLNEILASLADIWGYLNEVKASLNQRGDSVSTRDVNIVKAKEYINRVEKYLYKIEFRNDKHRANFRLLERVVNKEIRRLNRQSSLIGPSPDVGEIHCALNRLQYLINKTNKVVDTNQGPLENTYNKKPASKYIIENTDDREGRDDDLCSEQFNQLSYDSIDAMLSFKLRLWVKPYTYTKSPPGDDDFSEDIEETIPGRWRELPSLREALGNKLLGVNLYTLWGSKSSSQRNVETGLTDQNSFLTKK